jgi:hypothetical protein
VAPYTEHSPTITADIGWVFRCLQIVPPTGGEMQDLHANVCEDVYNAAGLSIGVVSVVSLGLIVKYIGMHAR